MSGLLLVLESRRATRLLGRALAPLLAVGDVVWLEGPLGAGKTFFARGLLRALGVPERVPVTSPTFALIHEHEGRAPVAHLDLYRIGDAGELRELGVEEVLASAIVVIEWGARLRPPLPITGVEIALERRDVGRIARIRALDSRGERIVARLREHPAVTQRARSLPPE